MMSFLGEVSVMSIRSSMAENDWVPPPRWGLFFVSWISHGFLSFCLSKKLLWEKGYKTMDFGSWSFLGWPGGCSEGDWDPPDNRHRHGSEASFVGSSVDMWQIQNRDEVNVIESPVMNLGRVELSVFNSNDCTLVYFCSILSLLFSLEAIAKYVRFPSMDCS